MADDWDDDRPGMMRVHIAQRRAQELCDDYSREGLRTIARTRGVPTGYRRKYDLAVAIVMAGADPRYRPESPAQPTAAPSAAGGADGGAGHG